ncbi:MAG TPA: molybdopterin-dependent oxidoreductase [Thermoanaerobaculia bacterium]
MRKIPTFFHEVQGRIPEPIDLAAYRLEIGGAVARPMSLSLDELHSLVPAVEVDRRFYCVNGWSLQRLWRGYWVNDLLAVVQPEPAVPYLRSTSLFGWEDTTAISDLGEALLVTHMDGDPLSPERGSPIRMIYFNMYQFKATKAIGRLEVVPDYRAGTWESVGYGDPTVQPYPHLAIDRNEELMPEPEVLAASEKVGGQNG